MPEDDKEEVLAVASPPNVLNPELRPEPGKATPKATTKAALKAVPTTEPDGIEAAVDQLSRDTAPVMAGWLRQIEAMLESAESIEEFQARLRAAYPTLDTTVIANTLTTAFSAMHLAGISDVEDEGG